MTKPELLKALRKNAKLRQMDVAISLGITCTRYAHMEKGRMELSRNDALLLARLYDMHEYDFRNPMDCATNF